MALSDMMAELRGLVPKFPVSARKTMINRAWADVCRKNLWSYLLWEDVWIAPPLINTGLATVAQGFNTVTFNAAAVAAINAGSTVYSTIAQRQFRIGVSRIYNIVNWDSVGGVATLDSVYGEVSGSLAYSIYQAYYPAPMQDFKSWISVRNMQSFIRLNVHKTREWLDKQDPQRTCYYFPTHVVPYQLDLNPASSTYQFPMFELWGAPLQNWTFQLYGLRKGTPLVNPGDTLPPQIGEDCVIERAKYMTFEWAEANKGLHPELAKTDWKFMMGESDARYKQLFKEYRMQDREYVNNFTSTMDEALLPKFWSYYNSIGGTAFPGFN